MPNVESAFSAANFLEGNHLEEFGFQNPSATKQFYFQLTYFKQVLEMTQGMSNKFIISQLKMWSTSFKLYTQIHQVNAFHVKINCCEGDGPL